MQWVAPPPPPLPPPHTRLQFELHAGDMEQFYKHPDWKEGLKYDSHVRRIIPAPDVLRPKLESWRDSWQGCVDPRLGGKALFTEATVATVERLLEDVDAWRLSGESSTCMVWLVYARSLLCVPVAWLSSAS